MSSQRTFKQIASKQPDGLTLIPFKLGRQLVWDATCRDTFCQSYVHLTSKTPGKAAEKGEDDKLKKYEELSHRYIVQPVAMETMGAWGQSSLKFIEEIGSRITLVTGDKRETSHLLQQLGIAVQKGNAISLRGCFSSEKAFHDLFNL